MKPLWKVKGFFNRTSWKVSDVQIVRKNLGVVFFLCLCLCVSVLCLCVLCVVCCVLCVVVVLVVCGGGGGRGEEKGERLI